MTNGLPTLPHSTPKILVVDDEADARDFMATAFRCEGYAVEVADDGVEAIEILSRRPTEFSAVFLDLLMPRKDGLAALREIRTFAKELPVFVTSVAASPGNVVEAIKAGATDFMPKPLTHEDLWRQMLQIAPPAEMRAGTGEVATRIFWGTSKPVQELKNTIRRISESEAPVLIQGETGSGKEVLAREIHMHSRRANRSFLKLNCAALPSELVESELFGYERGAFTGAFQRKTGMFELADGGTILLDEIGDMDFKVQAKLLQVLQDREFQRIGGKETVRVDVRVMAATHRDLELAIEKEMFREDLYYRLNVINLRLPPLRERKDEIIPLATRFLQKHGENGVPPQLPLALQQALMQHDWPGNIRELENLMRRYLVLRDPADLIRELAARSTRRPLAAAATGAIAAVSPPPPPAPSKLKEIPPPGERRSVLLEVAKAKEEAEATAILRVLESTRWNRKRAAQLLNIDYKALLYKMKKLNIGDKSARRDDP